MKVTTLADGTQLQYVKVSDPLGPRWISHADALLTTDRPEHALGMLPGDAMSLYQRLVGLGYEGLSLTNALPDAQVSRGQLKYAKTREDQQGWHIEFAEPVTAANFVQACQTAIDLAKVECVAQKAVAICFVAQGLPVQVAEADSAETQLALWGRKMSSSVEQSDQSVLADKAFADYEFGKGVMVTDTSGWEYTTPGHERTRKVYVETEREDGGPAPRWVLNFTVRFDADSGALAEAYALDNSGQKWGSMPVQRGVAEPTGTEARVAQEFPDFSRDDVIAVANLRGSLLSGKSGECSDLPASPLAQAVGSEIVTPASADYVRFKSAHSDCIKSLASELGSLSDSTHWELIDEMKGALGSSAANAADGNGADQEEVLSSAEAWVAENCSNGGVEEDVAMALWLRGMAEGESFLRSEKVAPDRSAPRA